MVAGLTMEVQIWYMSLVSFRELCVFLVNSNLVQELWGISGVSYIELLEKRTLKEFFFIVIFAKIAAATPFSVQLDFYISM